MLKNKSIKEEHKNFQGSPSLRRRALISVAERSLPATFLISFLYLFIVWATPIYRRYPDEVTSFGVAIVALATIRLAIVFFSKKFILKNYKVWKISFLGFTGMAALTWGLFQAASLYYFGLSWTSFLTSLVTLALCAGQITTFSLHYPLHVAFQSFMLVPTIIVNYFYVWGLQGTAIGTFFTGYYGLILFLGRIHNKQYWHATYEEARLGAMINALPGTLTWIDKGLRYLGVNQMQAEFWGLQPKEFIGQEVGFLQKGSEFSRFVKELFRSDKINMSRIITRNKKTHFIVGQKFNDNQEAVLLGTDVTNQYVMENELSKQREQSLYSAKLATVGELVSSITDEIEDPVEKLSQNEGNAQEHIETLQRRVRALKHFSADEELNKIPAIDLIEDLVSLNDVHLRKKQIRLELNIDKSTLSNIILPTEVFHSLLNLMSNAYDAVEDSSEKWIRIESTVKDKTFSFVVTDSGEGVPDYLEDVIFEPLYSTKESDKSTGVGLSISRQIIEKHNGRLYFNNEAENTQFIVKIPVDN